MFLTGLVQQQERQVQEAQGKHIENTKVVDKLL